MAEADPTKDVKATLDNVAQMLEEMRSHLSVLDEEQVSWVPRGEEVWPIQRAVTHCVNCEHHAVTELERALQGHPTPETIGADTAIFAWFGPTPYALARIVKELKEQVEALSEAIEPSHLSVEAVRYATHPPRKLLDYVEVMQRHTSRHLAGIRKKMAVMPPKDGYADELGGAYPDFGRGGA